MEELERVMQRHPRPGLAEAPLEEGVRHAVVKLKVERLRVSLVIHPEIVKASLQRAWFPGQANGGMMCR